jgi:hypothetical protein
LVSVPGSTSIVVSGSVTSTMKSLCAGVGSVFPAAVARTSKVCAPSARSSNV